nr:tyrosine-type recombinase/integrase [uncultured Desulfobacter sp.]
MSKTNKNSKECRTFRFNKRAIESLPPHDRDSASTEREYTDSECRNLKLSVSKNGKKYFLHRYRVKKGRKTLRRCYRIGEFPAVTVDDARAVVNENKRNLLLNGIDPQEAKEIKATELTFGEFFEEKYMIDHAKIYKKSWKCDQNKFDLDLKERFGDQLLSDIKKHDVIRFLNEIKERSSEASANRYLSLLSKVFSTAIDWEFLEGINPCSRIKKFKESEGRTRFLSQDEVRRLKSALDIIPQRLSSLLLWFLLCTGCRLGEACSLTWESVDFDQKIASLEGDKVKNGYSRLVMLNTQALDTLNRLKKYRIAGNPHVFPGRGPKGHITTPRKTFANACRMADIKDLRIHDLRHTYASWLASGSDNVSLYTISKLLGHKTVSMSARYSHLASKKLLNASESVSVQLEQAMK